MSFSGVDTYVTLGMLLQRMLHMADDGHDVLISGTIIKIGDKTYGVTGCELTLDDIERALRSVTAK